MMKKNDELTIRIEDLAFPNKGIGFADGYKVIVKDTLPEQEVSVRVKKKRNGTVEGKLLEVIKRSPLETMEGCSHFPVCGGCAYQRLSRKAEMELKEMQVLKLFHDAGISGFCYEGIYAADSSVGYRNKCEFSFGDQEQGGALALGMRKRGSRYEVVTLRDCNLVDSDYLTIIARCLSFFSKRQIPFFHKLRHDGELRHLVVRKGTYSGEILINLVTTADVHFSLQEFSEMLLETPLSGTICGILHTENDGVADVVKSDQTNILFGRDYFFDKLLGLTFRISAFSFFQTNTRGAEVLYSIVKEFAGNLADQVIFDLYCGTGTISQILAGQAKKVVGIELVEEAIAAAKENAAYNGIGNCEFIAGDVLQKVELLSDKPDLIVLDPPRDGIHPKAIHKIIAFGAPRIIYVSCKPTSLMRDLGVLLENGYQIERVKLLNQFERTVHCEVCAELCRQ